MLSNFNFYNCFYSLIVVVIFLVVVQEILLLSLYLFYGFLDMLLYLGFFVFLFLFQFVVSFIVLDGIEFGLGNQEIVGDYGQLVFELVLSNVFLSGFQIGGFFSYMVVMVVVMGEDFVDFLIFNDINFVQLQQGLVMNFGDS